MEKSGFCIYSIGCRITLVQRPGFLLAEKPGFVCRLLVTHHSLLITYQCAASLWDLSCLSTNAIFPFFASTTC